MSKQEQELRRHFGELFSAPVTRQITESTESVSICEQCRAKKYNEYVRLQLDVLAFVHGCAFSVLAFLCSIVVAIITGSWPLVAIIPISVWAIIIVIGLARHFMADDQMKGEKVARELYRTEMNKQGLNSRIRHGEVTPQHRYARGVWKIDTFTNEVNKSIRRIGKPREVAVGYDSVWITNIWGNLISRFDPNTQRVTDTIEVDETPGAIAIGNGAVWVANFAAGSVSKIDPTTNQVKGVLIRYPGHTVGMASIPVGSGPGDIAVGEGAIWVTNFFDGTLSKIDPSTNNVIETIQVCETRVGGPARVAVGEGGVWVTTAEQGTLLRIDPANHIVTEIYKVGLTQKSQKKAQMINYRHEQSHTLGLLSISAGESNQLYADLFC